VALVPANGPEPLAVPVPGLKSGYHQLAVRRKRVSLPDVQFDAAGQVDYLLHPVNFDGER
jgi:hypothetical protein